MSTIYLNKLSFTLIIEIDHLKQPHSSLFHTYRTNLSSNQSWNRSFWWNPYPSITLNELIFFENRSQKWKTSCWPTGTMYLKKWIISNDFTFHLSFQPSCLPSLLLLSLSVPSQKHSPQQFLTMILFIVLWSLTTMLNTLYGILMTPTCSSANEAFFLAFIDETSIILISLDDYNILNHARLQQ